MHDSYKMTDLNFTGFHNPPPGQNLRTAPTRAAPTKFELIFVKRGPKGVEMITWSHFPLLVSWKKKVKLTPKKS